MPKFMLRASTVIDVNTDKCEKALLLKIVERK